VAGGSETILVVEDDPAVRATVVEMLGSLGYRVLKADNAADALGIVKSGMAIDLLFTDVVMPGPLRSPELARQAKAMHPQLAVLFTSGYTQNAIVHGGRLDPGVELLSKPYGREQLARRIRHVLANRVGHVEETPSSSASAAPSTVRQPAPQPAPPANALRILVVEDNPDLMDLACRLFEALGQTAHGAPDVAAAEAVLAARPVDVLFTDIDLAGQSGVDLAARARRRQPGLRIVFASGYGAPERGGLAFPFEVVAKPYRLADLHALLSRGAPQRSPDES
jgi:CheY-like chemotaxis protein